MRKIFYIILLISICLLSGCGEKKSMIGLVTEVQPSDIPDCVNFVIRTDTGKQFGILMSSTTYLTSYFNEVDRDQLLDGTKKDVVISIMPSGRGKSMTTADGKKLKTYIAASIHITSYLTDETLQLSDGTDIQIWKELWSYTYRFKDRTELLEVSGSTVPDGVVMNNGDNLYELPKSAQKNILAFYEKQGLLYDVTKTLEQAYHSYQLLKAKRQPFNAYYLSQSIYPTASSEKVMYFLTSVSFPLGGGDMDEREFSVAFDKETGKPIKPLELFHCSKEKTIDTILDLAKLQDLTLIKEMREAFSLKHIIFYEDNMQIVFPKGSLPSEKNGLVVSLDYTDSLCAILQPWAIPIQVPNKNIE